MKSYLIGILLALSFFTIMLATLPDYGIQEDSPFHFLRGQAYLQKMLNGKDTFDSPPRTSPVLFAPGQKISLYKPNASEEINAPLRPVANASYEGTTIQNRFKNIFTQLGHRESFYKHNSWNSNYWDFQVPNSHPAVSDLLMALSNRIFYEKLGVLPDIDAYHLYIIVVTSITIFFIYLFTQRTYGYLAALFASITLALFPYFFAESHFNIKDPVQMSFFTISTISFYFWVSTKFRLRWFTTFLISTFLALGTKWNIAFLPIILLLWGLSIVRRKEVKNFLTLPNIIIYLALAIIVPFILLIAFWPFLWTNTFPRLLDTFHFYSGVGFKPEGVYTPPSALLPMGFDATALLRAISMTPPLSLLLFILGIIDLLKGFSKPAYRPHLLLLLWLFIPLLRVSRQEVDLQGSIRNYIEYLPAFAIIAGIGGSFLTHKLIQLIKFNKKFLMSTACLLYLFPLIFTITKFHPNENAYFNSLFGGLKGAEKSNYLYVWQTSYDNPYREAILWLNKNAPSGAHLAYLDGTMLAISPLWLRGDIAIGSYFSGYDQNGEYIVSLVYPNPPPVFPYLYLERFLSPLYQLKVDGVPILKIWQNDKSYLKKDMTASNSLPNISPKNESIINDRKIWEVSFGKTQKITKLILKVPVGNCTDHRGIWSTTMAGKENFMSLYDTALDNETREIDFPAEPADSIRFWDIEGNSCIYNAEVEKIYVL